MDIREQLEEKFKERLLNYLALLKHRYDYTPAMIEQELTPLLIEDVLALAQEDCPECGGSKYYIETITESNNDEFGGCHEIDVAQPCPKCNGAGKVPLEMKLIENPYDKNTQPMSYDLFQDAIEAQLAADKDVMTKRVLADKVDKGEK